MTTKSYIVIKDKAQTLSNKTIDADSNVIQNLEAGNFKAQATTEAGKCFGVKSDGSIGLISGGTPAVDNTTIEINSDDKLAVKDGGISLAKLATQATTDKDKCIQVDTDGTFKLSDSGYLPLSGGTMTGTIVSTNTGGTDPIIIASDDTSSVVIRAGGESGSTCYGTLELRGNYGGSDSGGFLLQAYNGSNYSTLHGSPAGSLTWGNYDVETEKHKTLTVNSSSTDEQYPSAKAVYTELDKKVSIDNDTTFTIKAGDNWLVGTSSDLGLGIRFGNKELLTTERVVDNLTTDSSTQVLSAKQGKVLNDTKLSLTGGTMTGTIVSNGASPIIKNKVSSSDTSIYGGTSTSDGGNIVLSGADSSSDAGCVTATAASSSTTTNTVKIKPTELIIDGGNDPALIKIGSSITATNKIAELQGIDTDTDIVLAGGSNTTSDPYIKLISNSSVSSTNYGGIEFHTGLSRSDSSAGNLVLNSYEEAMTWDGTLKIGSDTTDGEICAVSSNNCLNIRGGNGDVCSSLTLYAADDTESEIGKFVLSSKGVIGTKSLIGKNDGTLTWVGNQIETQNNRVTSISSSSTDTQYPSAKAVYSNTSDKLPLAGGTMSGTLILPGTTSIKCSSDSTALTIYGGTGTSGKPFMSLNGVSSGTNAGAFSLCAANSSASELLIGKPDGDLTWCGNPICVKKSVTVTKTFSTGFHENTDSYTAHNFAYKIADNVYYISMGIISENALTTGTSYEVHAFGNLLIDGLIPKFNPGVWVENQTLSLHTCWINYRGRIYLRPQSDIAAGAKLNYAGIVYCV